MEILERIEAQMAASQLPLFAVTIAAVPCPDTPVILTLHWHGFVRERLVDLEEAEVVTYIPIPSSALQVNDRWSDILDLDRAAMEAGWELGAWDVARAERASCDRPGADSSEAIDCLKAFGAFPFGINGQQPVVADARISATCSASRAGAAPHVALSTRARGHLGCSGERCDASPGRHAQAALPAHADPSHLAQIDADGLPLRPPRLVPGFLRAGLSTLAFLHHAEVMLAAPPPGTTPAAQQPAGPDGR